MEKNDIGNDVKSFINLMDLDELIKLNKYVVKRIRLISDTRVMEKVQDFELLENVYFFDESGRLLSSYKNIN